MKNKMGHHCCEFLYLIFKAKLEIEEYNEHSLEATLQDIR